MGFPGNVLEFVHTVDRRRSIRVGEVQLTGQQHTTEAVRLYRDGVDRGAARANVFLMKGTDITLVAEADMRLRWYY